MRNYYAYIFRDPRTHLPFYVGKGSGQRAYRLSSRLQSVLQQIKEIEDSGFKHLVEIIEAPSEREAFWSEKNLIATIGRINSGTGPLLNLCEGTETRSSGQTVEGKQSISRAMKGNKLRLNKEFTPAQLDRISAGVKKTMTPERLEKLRLAGLKGSQRSAELGLNKLGGTHDGAFKKGNVPHNAVKGGY